MLIAYTVARPPASSVTYSNHDNHDDGELKQLQQEQLSIEDMPNEIFDWPKDLQLKPNLLLVLCQLIKMNDRNVLIIVHEE